MRLTEIFKGKPAKILTAEPAIECDGDEVAWLDIRVVENDGSDDPEDSDCIYLNRSQVEELRDYLTELLG